ncbi:MAG: methylated-DNA--[protein]-cysteine S-methyltransferase [Myxococcales bacterium]|nr:MAG: methylated-DNA--[protein]-cysteine S-methyltransferase [Myxococcales bacterium]
MLTNLNAPYFSQIESPIGPLLLLGDSRALCALYMVEHRHQPALPPGCARNDAALSAVVAQLRAYFAGELTEFDVELSSQGTEFQSRVWQALRSIGYGRTESYGQLARRIGNPSASRAVGLANGKNPISIIVPCHRVIGANGSLTGYGGGMERKKWLLEHERRVTEGSARGGLRLGARLAAVAPEGRQ